MDKQTLSNYGLLTVVTLILAVMLAFATPFGTYVGDGVVSIANGFVGASDKGLDEDNISSLEKQWSDKLNTGTSNGIIPTGATYTPNGGTAITGNGINTFPATPQTGDTYEEGDYIYKYNQYYSGSSWYSNTSQNGWGVKVKDTSKTSYGGIISEIAGRSITNMNYTFHGCKSLISAPAIPNSVTSMSGTFGGCNRLTTAPDMSNANSVTNMNGTFAGCTRLTTAPVIPNSVTNMQGTFWDCTSLTTAPTIPNSVTNMDSTFFGCTSLTGIIEVNTNPTDYMYCLSGTQITGITGSCSQTTKDALMATK